MYSNAQEYLDALKQRLEGFACVSNGACPSCEACGYEQAVAPHFSWLPCDACGSVLGGTRYPAHGRVGGLDGRIIHLEICENCLFYIEYGTLPHFKKE